MLRKVRRLAGRVIAGAGELLGSGLLVAMRLLALPTTRTDVFRAERVLVVGAHPDDEISLGSVVFSPAFGRGGELTVLILTSGGASRAGGLPPETMAARRAVELRKSCARLGAARVIHLGHPEWRWDPEAVRAVVAEEVRLADLVCTHSPVDYNPDHLRLSRLVAEVVAPGQRVWLGELQTLLTPLLSNRVVRLSPAEVAMRDAATAAHVTQAGTLAAIQRQQRLLARAHGGREVMTFWEMDGATLQRVTACAAEWIDAPARTPFRGVRLRGFSDPLAVMRGTLARWRLRKVAPRLGTSR